MAQKPLTGPSKYHMTVIGAELYCRRLDKGWTQQKLADLIRQASGRANLSRQYISQLEAPGEHEVPIDIAIAVDKIFS
jgi:transcriptional regulator with XRE-family HTH domain